MKLSIAPKTKNKQTDIDLELWVFLFCQKLYSIHSYHDTFKWLEDDLLWFRLWDNPWQQHSGPKFQNWRNDGQTRQLREYFELSFFYWSVICDVCIKNLNWLVLGRLRLTVVFNYLNLLLEIFSLLKCKWSGMEWYFLALALSKMRAFLVRKKV